MDKCLYCLRNEVEEKHDIMCRECELVAKHVFEKTGSPIAVLEALKRRKK